MTSLKGNRIVVTGGATGIGEAVSHRCAMDGARVLVAGLPDDPVQDVVDEIRDQGREAQGFQGDLSREKIARRCVQAALGHWGGIDGLVNNAGIFPAVGETQDYPLEDFDRLVAMNCRTAFLMTKHALPHLQTSRGAIVSAGSEAGKIGIADVAAYGATKGWMHAFTRGVAVEQARYGVRANCVCPGPIDTAWTRKDLGPMGEEMEDTMIAATPLGRRGTPEEVANVYAFLLSDEASYVTGALWSVDGGVTVAKGPVGERVPEELRARPPGRLALRHSRDGLRDRKSII